MILITSPRGSTSSFGLTSRNRASRTGAGAARVDDRWDAGTGEEALHRAQHRQAVEGGIAPLIARPQVRRRVLDEAGKLVDVETPPDEGGVGGVDPRHVDALDGADEFERFRRTRQAFEIAHGDILEEAPRQFVGKLVELGRRRSRHRRRPPAAPWRKRCLDRRRRGRCWRARGSWRQAGRYRSLRVLGRAQPAAPVRRATVAPRRSPNCAARRQPRSKSEIAAPARSAGDAGRRRSAAPPAAARGAPEP